jgi:hypothetical protein
MSARRLGAMGGAGPGRRKGFYLPIRVDIAAGGFGRRTAKPAVAPPANPQVRRLRASSSAHPFTV